MNSMGSRRTFQPAEARAVRDLRVVAPAWAPCRSDLSSEPRQEGFRPLTGFQNGPYGTRTTAVDSAGPAGVGCRDMPWHSLPQQR